MAALATSMSALCDRCAKGRLQVRALASSAVTGPLNIRTGYDTSSYILIIVERFSMINLTVRQLRAFSLLAQHRNFSRAAEALFITPSGLSVLIRELESQLGFRLFDRTTRHVVLTAYGQELLPIAQKSLADVDGAVSRIGRTATESSRTLSVGASPLIAANVLPQAIKEFRAHQPALSIQLVDCEPASIIPMVESGKVDIGLRVLYKPIPG